MSIQIETIYRTRKVFYLTEHQDIFEAIKILEEKGGNAGQIRFEEMEFEDTEFLEEFSDFITPDENLGQPTSSLRVNNIKVWDNVNGEINDRID